MIPLTKKAPPPSYTTDENCLAAEILPKLSPHHDLPTKKHKIRSKANMTTPLHRILLHEAQSTQLRNGSINYCQRHRHYRLASSWLRALCFFPSSTLLTSHQPAGGERAQKQKQSRPSSKALINGKAPRADAMHRPHRHRHRHRGIGIVIIVSSFIIIPRHWFQLKLTTCLVLSITAYR